jgi:hypothetical protein
MEIADEQHRLFDCEEVVPHSVAACAARENVAYVVAEGIVDSVKADARGGE